MSYVDCLHVLEGVERELEQSWFAPHVLRDPSDCLEEVETLLDQLYQAHLRLCGVSAEIEQKP
ncbi:MAG: hypothetical protein WCA32_19330 [Chromatiaceae bacterium]|jgi:hypothetical protein